MINCPFDFPFCAFSLQ